MKLDSNIVSQFVKATKDTTKKKTESTVYGTAVIQNGTTYVRIDGSELLTPAISTADTKNGERVTVMIKNHTAVITGNVSSPAARTEDVQNLAGAALDYEAIKKSVDGLVVDMCNCANDIDNLQKEQLELSGMLSSQERTMSAIDLKLTNIENDMAEYDLSITKIEADILSLKLTATNLQKSINTINETLTTHGDSIETINTTLSEHGDSITSINDSLEDIVSRLEALENPSE